MVAAGQACHERRLRQFRCSGQVNWTLSRRAALIVPIYLEATGDDTEQRLSRAIRRACPTFDDDLSLTLLLKNLRRGVGLPSGKKALIVLDQFEQWLHAKRGQTNQELPAALRQCDKVTPECPSRDHA